MRLASFNSDTATITAASYSDSQSSPTDSQAGINFDNNGNVYRLLAGVSTLQYAWHTGVNAATDYSVRCASITSGTFTTEAAVAGSWVALGGATDRIWDAQVTGIGTKTVTAVFEIKSNITGIVLATASVTLSAEVVI